MTNINHKRNNTLLIRASDLLDRIKTKETATLVDVRNPKPWDRSDIKIREAVRIDPERLPLDPAWPQDALLVFY